jgi:hypothetical protein
MTPPMVVIAVTAFLSGAALAVFVMIAVGIRKADRPRHLSPAPTTPIDAVTRSLLKAGTWPNRPGPGDPAQPATRTWPS